MIIDLPNTRTREISAKIDELHEERGESATGRVLTLLIRTDDAELENSLEVANAASREHPCRVIAIVPNTHATIASGAVSAEGEDGTDGEGSSTKTADESNLDAQVRFGAKVPGGSAMEVRDVSMDFSYGRSFTESSPEAYERLILDVLLGDPPLFPTTEEVDLSWKILDPIEQFWSTLGQPQPYRAGTWGPAEADEMLARDGRHWRMP